MLIDSGGVAAGIIGGMSPGVIGGGGLHGLSIGTNGGEEPQNWGCP